MTKFRLFIFALLSLILCSLAIPVHAQAGIQLVSDEAISYISGKRSTLKPSSRQG